MKALLLGVLFVLAVGVGYPLINEGTTSACSALERRLITSLPTTSPDLSTVVVLGSLQKSLSNGSFTTTMVKQRSPNVPPFVSCGLAYWQITVDPGKAQAMINELLSGKPTNFGVINRTGSPAAPANEVIKTVSPAIEADEAMRALTNPTAPRPAATADQPAPTPTYKPSDQRELNRLINNQR
jgi:hypothetical protein